jgi:hypothetical protein
VNIEGYTCRVEVVTIHVWCGSRKRCIAYLPASLSLVLTVGGEELLE